MKSKKKVSGGNSNCVYNCLKEKCPKWVVLTNIIKLDNGEVKNELQGKCAIAWIPQLLIELRNKGI
jgi:hypothetical protein